MRHGLSIICWHGAVLTGMHSTIDVKIAFVINKQSSICLTLHNFEPGESQDTKTSDFHIRSFYARNLSPVTRKNDLQTYLKQYLEQFSMLGAIAIIFDNYNKLLSDTAAHRPVPFNPLIAHNKYVLVYRRSQTRRSGIWRVVARPHGDSRARPDWVGINPITLAPTGTSFLQKLDKTSLKSSLSRSGLE